MRGFCLGGALLVAVLFPKNGTGQVFQFRTPPPDVSAAGAPWQIGVQPIIVDGVTFRPTREFRIFDGQIMAQTGMYEHVPVYSDLSREPYTQIYIPVGNGRMRVYERLPVPARERSVGTAGSSVPAASSETVTRAEPSTPARMSILTSVPDSSGVNGVWLEFDGARWYSDGPAVPYAADRFAPLGDYRGFPVYRDRMSQDNRIWVSVVTDGPIAPYRRQQ
jgi:hypothetical protein